MKFDKKTQIINKDYENIQKIQTETIKICNMHNKKRFRVPKEMEEGRFAGNPNLGLNRALLIRIFFYTMKKIKKTKSITPCSFVIYKEGRTETRGDALRRKDLTREDEIFRKLKQGDEQAPEELVRLYYPEILRYCLWHAPDRMTAEDAAQETFLKAIRYLDRYEHKGKFRPFLYQIAANTCVDEWRKKKAGPLPEELEYTEPEFIRAEADLDFRLLVERLPEDTKEIVLLRFAQELTLREIGLVLELPLRTVQSRLRKALKQIKKEIQEGGDKNGK